jgi:hypothetical protein
VRVGAIVVFSLLLVLGSFVVGNFGLSEGTTGAAALIVSRVDVSLMAQVRDWFTSLGFSFHDYSYADGIIWLCVILALLDSLRDKRRLGVDTNIREHVPPRRFKRLKHPPVPQQPKRHHGYRLAMVSRN